MKRSYSHQLYLTAALIPRAIAIFFLLLFFTACIINYAHGRSGSTAAELKGEAAPLQDIIAVQFSYAFIDASDTKIEHAIAQRDIRSSHQMIVEDIAAHIAGTKLNPGLASK